MKKRLFAFALAIFVAFAAALSLQSFRAEATIPGSNVTSEVFMDNEELKADDFTIGNGGVVLGPNGGTAKIENCTVTNNAVNSRKGSYSTTNGSAFISRGANGLAFKNTIINSDANNLVFNIWADRSITAENTTLKGSANASNDTPFLMIGGYPNGGAGTLNFKGESRIEDAKGSVVGGNNNSVINVEADGALILNDSDIKLRDGVKIVVKDGAVLAISNTKLTNATIIVEDGGTLVADQSDFTNCVIKCKGEGLVSLRDSVLHDSSRSSQEAMIHTEGSGALVVLDKCQVRDNTNTASAVIRVENGSLAMRDTTFTNNSSEAWGGAIYANNSTVLTTDCTFENNKSTKGGAAMCAVNTTTEIASSTFTGNTSGANGEGGALNVNGGSLIIDDESTFEKNHARMGGAIFMVNVPEAEIGAALFSHNGYQEDLPGIEDQSNLDGGALYVNSTDGKTYLELNGTKLERNIAAAMGTTSGGAAYITGANTEVWMRGVKVAGNTAGTYGGGVSVNKADVKIRDLDGDPSEFVGNLVQYGYDHAGGGLFIKDGYVTLWDAAIYDNYARDGGGGISSCTKGTAQAKVLDGASIYNNHVFGTDPVQTPEGEMVAPETNPINDDVKNYQDVYFQTKDHKNAETGEPYQEGDFPLFPFELYERMFNGGLHNWKTKPFESSNDQSVKLNSLMAQSNPTNTDTSGAKVIFTQNVATLMAGPDDHPGWANKTITGGAIATNGLLQMGNGTEVKIVKAWYDDRNNDGYRPSKDEFLDKIVLKADGEPSTWTTRNTP